ncbi:hypothetical protein [Nonomuraea sp. bgisy101]
MYTRSRVAGRMAGRRVLSGEPTPERTLLPHELVVRATTAPPP